MSKKLKLNERFSVIDSILEECDENNTVLYTSKDLYENLYNILSFFIRINPSSKKVGYDILEDMKQNIIHSFFERCVKKLGKESIRVDHLYTYFSKVVNLEFSKIYTEKYLGTAQSSYSEEDLLHNPDFEVETTTHDNSVLLISLQDNCKRMVKEINHMLSNCPAGVINKKLFMFAVFLSIARGDATILRNYPFRVRSLLKEIAYEIGDPVEYIR